MEIDLEDMAIASPEDKIAIDRLLDFHGHSMSHALRRWAMTSFQTPALIK
jgi:hypothetical protein